MSERLDTCALCPRLCRPACPVATATGREAAVPSFLAGLALRVERGQWDPALAEEGLALCVDCDACARFCHVHQPLGDLLREARHRLVGTPTVEAVGAPEGDAAIVYVQADDREAHGALAGVLGVQVAPWRTESGLGVALRGSARWESHLDAVRVAMAGREAVVADGGSATVLTAAGVRFRWLDEVTGGAVGRASCVTDPREDGEHCCGGAGPLPDAHPVDAARLAARWIARGDGPLRDARCRNHVRRCGHAVGDAVDGLIGGDDA